METCERSHRNSEEDVWVCEVREHDLELRWEGDPHTAEEKHWCLCFRVRKAEAPGRRTHIYGWYWLGLGSPSPSHPPLGAQVFICPTPSSPLRFSFSFATPTACGSSAARDWSWATAVTMLSPWLRGHQGTLEGSLSIHGPLLGWHSLGKDTHGEAREVCWLLGTRQKLAYLSVPVPVFNPVRTVRVITVQDSLASWLSQGSTWTPEPDPAVWCFLCEKVLCRVSGDCMA